MNVDIQGFRDAITRAVPVLAANTLGANLDAAGQDARDVLAQSGAKVEAWLRLLAEGRIDQDEFRLLVRARQANISLHALQAAGITRSGAERFREGLTSLLVDCALDALF